MKTNPDSRPIIEIGEANFESEVLRWKQPVLVAFSAAWSRPCQILDSVLEEVAVACAGREKVVRINADNNPDLSLVWKIQSIPTLLYFIDGSLRARIVGTASKEGKSYEPFQQPDSNREPKPRLQSVPNGFSDVQIFDPAQLFTSNLIRR